MWLVWRVEEEIFFWEPITGQQGKTIRAWVSTRTVSYRDWTWSPTRWIEQAHCATGTFLSLIKLWDGVWETRTIFFFFFFSSTSIFWENLWENPDNLQKNSFNEQELTLYFNKKMTLNLSMKVKLYFVIFCGLALNCLLAMSVSLSLLLCCFNEVQRFLWLNIIQSENGCEPEPPNSLINWLSVLASW